EELGGEIAGGPVEFVVRDDEGRPDVGRQIANEMVRRDKVNFMIVPTISNVLLSTQPLVVGSKTIMFGGQAGPGNLAGQDCSPYFFSVGIETETMGQAMGMVMQDLGIEAVVLATPNYAG